MWGLADEAFCSGIFFHELRSQRCDNVTHKVQQNVHQDLALNTEFLKTSSLYKKGFLNYLERQGRAVSLVR